MKGTGLWQHPQTVAGNLAAGRPVLRAQQTIHLSPVLGPGSGAAGRKCAFSPWTRRQGLLSQFSAFLLVLSDRAAETAASPVHCAMPGRAVALPTARRFFLAHKEKGRTRNGMAPTGSWVERRPWPKAAQTESQDVHVQSRI